ncbi:MAG: phosphoadenylyl-sulfate reductase [Rhizobiaceae bacterium]
MLHKLPDNATVFKSETDASALSNLYNLEGLSPQNLLKKAIEEMFRSRIAMVSSFGAESVVLLHMISKIDKSLPVLFLDTQFLFRETLDYQRTVAYRLGLTNVQTIVPDEHQVSLRDPNGDLHNGDQGSCCTLRKTEPLNQALEGYDAWISGRKRHQSDTRAQLQPLEQGDDGRFKLNPLAEWNHAELRQYIDMLDLPRHPLVAKGFASIGCEPCTTPVAEGEDPRSGRWRNSEKTECGIHTETAPDTAFGGQI